MQRLCRVQEFARIRVVGIGGGGLAAVNAMIDRHIFGVDFLTVDTAALSIKESKALSHLHLDYGITDSRGSCGNSAAAYKAALLAEERINNALKGSDIVFVLAGLGGGSGSGAAQVVARAASQQGALVIAIVTYPFAFEGVQRTQTAKKAVSALKSCTDTLVVIPNERLLERSQGMIGFHETYCLAQEIWSNSIQGISELINRSGLINVDFADVRAVMREGGAAVITSGRAKGKNRALVAAQQASRSELLGLTLDGARGLLFNVVGGSDMTLHEIKEAAALLTGRAHPAANVIFGATIDDTLDDEIRITAISTGFQVRTLLQEKASQPERQHLGLGEAIRKTAERIYAAVPA